MTNKLKKESPDHWRKAKCAGTVTTEYDPFFDESEQQEAIDFCNGEADGTVCPIRHECLIFALQNNEKFGVWGGSSPLTRKAIRRKHPQRTKDANPAWEFMTEDSALEGLDRKALEKELEKEQAAVDEEETR